MVLYSKKRKKEKKFILPAKYNGLKLYAVTSDGEKLSKLFQEVQKRFQPFNLITLAVK